MKHTDYNFNLNTLIFNDFTETEVNDTILKLKSGKSPGNITAEILKKNYFLSHSF